MNIMQNNIYQKRDINCSNKNSENMVGEHQRSLQKYMQGYKKWIWWRIQITEDHYLEVLQ